MKKYSRQARKLMAMLLACCLLITIIGLFTASAEDLSGHWAASEINLLIEKGIVRGDGSGNINPEKNITRAEFVAIINRAFKFDETGDTNFPDVKSSAWYCDDLSIAKNEGYLLGDSNGNANPDKPIIRAEAALIFARVLELKPKSETSDFEDSDSFPDWSVEAIIAMTENEYIKGYPDKTFRAANNITRAEAFTILARVIAEKVSPTSPPTSGGGSGGGSNSGGGNTVKDPVSLTVETQFPSGNIESNEIAVSYTALTDVSESITEVYYSINDGAPEYIYINGVYGSSNKGTLGSGKVLFVPGENSIVFTAKDTRGETAIFTVTNKPIYTLETTDDIDAGHLRLSDTGNYLYINNRIIAYAIDNAPSLEIQDVVNSIEGNIVNYVGIVDLYEIEVSEGTEEQLDALIETLMTCGLFEFATTSKVYDIGTDANPTNDPWWGNQEWGLSAINIPEAWSEYSQLFREIKVSVCDNGFDVGHEDLLLKAGNVTNREIATKDHGTHVLGTIAAIKNNNKGLAGILGVNRDNVYANDIFDIDASIIPEWYEFWRNQVIRDNASDNAQLEGLRYSVLNGAKTINYSVGGGGYDSSSAARYAIEMRKLLRKGYDFLVVSSAGNDETADAEKNNGFCAIKWFSGVQYSGNTPINDTTDVTQNVIVVGAINRDNQICDFSSYGERVDVVAPGRDIYSTVRSGYDGTYYGTSMAAPHITGLASLVWSVNPGLTAAQVKDVIVSTANTTIYDRENGNVDGDFINRASNERIPYHLVDAKAAIGKAISLSSDNVGNVVGKVVVADQDNDPTNNDPISNAVISLHQSFSPGLNGELDNPFFSTTSDIDGNYRFNNIPTGAYYYQVTAEGYIPIQGYIQVTAGVTTYINALEGINSVGNGIVSGNIVNAYDGAIIIGPEITLIFRKGLDISDMPVSKTIASTNGVYSVELPAGNYTVTATGEGFIETASYVVSIGNATRSNQNVIISPKLGEGNVRIVLSWGFIPSDLDSHLIGPSSTAESGKFHTWYSEQGYIMSENRYTRDIVPNNDYDVALDVDDVDSYGPETTTIYRPINGVYNFYVHDYSNRNSTNSSALRNSQAVVRIYDETNILVAQYSVPTDGGYSTLWHVFSIRYNNGSWDTPVAVNNMSNEPILPGVIGMN